MKIREMKEIKKEKGYSISDLSAKTGIPVGTLTKVFSGETRNPRRATMEALESFFANERSKEISNERSGPDACVREGSALYRAIPALSGLPGAAPVCENDEKRQGKYTVKDLACFEDASRIELIDGVLYYNFASPSLSHQRVALSFYRQADRFIRENGGSCEAFVNSVDVYLEDFEKNCLIPDFFIVCDEEIKQERGIYGAPDFVLEILSPSSEYRDTVIKRKKYMQAGVREYWILDFVRQCVCIYLKDDPIGRIHPLSGRLGVEIYGGKLQIDLDEIRVLAGLGAD